MADYKLDTIINSLTVDRMLSILEPEEADVLRLWMSDSYTLREIAEIVGIKYQGSPWKVSVVRYTRDKALKKLQTVFNPQP